MILLIVTLQSDRLRGLISGLRQDKECNAGGNLQVVEAGEDIVVEIYMDCVK